MTAPPVQFVCPACRTPVTLRPTEYVCVGCSRRYPVVLGIPDFRFTPDPWLSIEEDRAKGERLEDQTRGLSLERTVEAYWRTTPATSARRASRFIQHVMGAERRSREWLQSEGLDASTEQSTWIDLGCGTADLAAVVGEARPVIAIDIAFRWLVVARRRLEERGVMNVSLVCADARALPLAQGVAGRVLSLGLLEHVTDPRGLLEDARRVLAPGGRVHLRTTNRFSALPEPHVNVWGVGWLPRRAADGYVRRRTGEGYDHLRPSSARELRRSMRQAGFVDIVVAPAMALPSDVDRLGRGRILAAAYNQGARLPIARRALAWIAPLLEVRGATP